MKIWKKSLLTRIVVGFIVLAIISNTLLTFFTYRQAQAQVTQAIYASLETAATMREEAIKQWINSQAERLLYLAQLDLLEEQAAVLTAESRNSMAYEAAHDELTGFLVNALAYEKGFKDLMFLDRRQGEVLVSTNPIWEGEYRVRDQYFVEGRWGTVVQHLYLSPVTNQMEMTVATPVRGSQWESLGVLVVNLNLAQLSGLVFEQSGLDAGAEIYLVDPNYVGVGSFDPEQVGGRGLHSEAIEAAILDQEDGYGTYLNYAGERVVGAYRWIDYRGMALVMELNERVALEPARRLAVLILGAGILITLLLSVGIYAITARIVRPIRLITETATAVADGDLTRQAPVLTEDELGLLARTFNRMTEQLRVLYGELEARVAERTQALTRRSEQLRVAAEVARDAAAEREVSLLLQRAVDLISQRFGFYHAGLFLVDDAGQYAVLKAASSAGGQQMLKRGHRLAVGAQGIVGYVAESGGARIALDVGKDAVFFDNPDLPDTRSELAVPLKVGEELIGVLDVQSVEPNAFNEETEEILQLMADQLSIALLNARLLQQHQLALEELERSYGRRWAEQLEHWEYAFRYSGIEVESLSGADVSAGGTAGQVLQVPIVVRGHSVGTLQVRRTEEDEIWAEEEHLFLSRLGEQVGMALDSVQLLENIRRREVRERLIGDVMTRIRSSLDMQTVLQTAARELRAAVRASELTVQLVQEPEAQSKGKGTDV